MCCTRVWPDVKALDDSDASPMTGVDECIDEQLLTYKHSLWGAVGKFGLEPASPSTEKQADGFSHLLHSVLRIGSCQWNWVVADATAAPRLVPDGTSQAPNPM